ncbi:unnamed protein product [Strongylus vulgaris]|uniref:Phlebovirus glycoprotein G2 fusion domain-containing protein n=1 Tax=Strongylus vulgaris TaxID=40348 RepID=A0A3P7IJN2_STRVU|nr:unnamed protein product [Strongylus vulgaris]
MAVAVLLIIIALLVAAVVILAVLTATGAARHGSENVKGIKKLDTSNQLWSELLRPKNCAKTEYLQKHPPLVILSLSGLSNVLAASFIALNKIRGYGISAEAVYSCIPENNATNRIAITTGLYPGSQKFGNLSLSFNCQRHDYSNMSVCCYHGQTCASKERRCFEGLVIGQILVP